MGKKNCDYCGERIFFAVGTSGKLTPFNDGSGARHDCHFTKSAARGQRPQRVMAAESTPTFTSSERNYETALPVAGVLMSPLLFMLAVLATLLATLHFLPTVIHLMFQILAPK
jgi:hypothetical protein